MTCLEELKSLRTKYGTGEFDHSIKTLNRERLENYNRPKRISFKWSLYRKLYRKQFGLCGICEAEMALIKGKVSMDHKNPNAEDFNDESNLQVTHVRCNLEKSSKSIPEQSKETGKPFTELV